MLSNTTGSFVGWCTVAAPEETVEGLKGKGLWTLRGVRYGPANNKYLYYEEGSKPYCDNKFNKLEDRLIVVSKRSKLQLWYNWY